MASNCNSKKLPHARQSEPGEELDHRKLLHRGGHLFYGKENLRKTSNESFIFTFHPLERFDVLGRVLFCSDYRP